MMRNHVTWNPVEDTYEDVKRWLDKRVAQFYRHYGWKWVERVCGPYSEMRSLADEIFMDAYLTYERRSNFTTWVGNKVWYGLKDVLRKRTLHKQLDLNLDEMPEHELDFDLFDFMRGLSGDAREVVSLVCLETPTDIMLGLAEIGRDTPAAFKLVLKEYLHDAGWSWDRIRNTFTEIKGALVQ